MQCSSPWLGQAAPLAGVPLLAHVHCLRLHAPAFRWYPLLHDAHVEPPCVWHTVPCAATPFWHALHTRSVHAPAVLRSYPLLQDAHVVPP